jgi:hypothetical protein
VTTEDTSIDRRRWSVCRAFDFEEAERRQILEWAFERVEVKRTEGRTARRNWEVAVKEQQKKKELRIRSLERDCLNKSGGIRKEG